MKTIELAKQIIELINKNGGATLNPNSFGIYKGDGYAVGIKGFECVCDLSSSSMVIKLIRKTINNAIENDSFAGFWVDNGQLYGDVSEVILSKKNAIKSAISRCERAIFCFSTKKLFTSTRIFTTYK